MLKGGLETNVLKVLTEEDIRKIHTASMKVLAEVGVMVNEKTALDLC